MSPALLLATIAGGRRDILVQSRGDIGKYAAMGGVILTTACVAAASGAVAVNMALRLPPPLSVVVGLLWGVIIFNLDRLMVTQMVRQTNRTMLIWLAAPRVALAVILGFVISTPLVLKVFDVEIGTELQTMHRELIASYQARLDSTLPFNQIPKLEKAVTDAQAVLANGSPNAVDEDPGVKAAQDRYDQAEKAFTTAEAAVVCEKEGTCGSGKVGAGIAFREKVQIRDDAKKARDDALSALNAIRAKVTAAQGTANEAKQAAARQTIETSTRQLGDLRPKRTDALDEYTKQANHDTGLLARLEALNRLSSERATLSAAHWTLFLLFLAIELMPVMFKLLQIMGPVTNYEALGTREDAAIRRMHKRAAAQRLRQQRSQLGVADKLENDRAKRAKAAGIKHNRKLVATQSAVISEALQTWSEHAEAEAEAALARWRQRAASSPEVHPPDAPEPTATDDLAQDWSAPVQAVDHDWNGMAQFHTGNGHHLPTADPRQGANGAAALDPTEPRTVDIARAKSREPVDQTQPQRDTQPQRAPLTQSGKQPSEAATTDRPTAKPKSPALYDQDDHHSGFDEDDRKPSSDDAQHQPREASAKFQGAGAEVVPELEVQNSWPADRG